MARKLHGTSANQLSDFYGLAFDAAVKCQEDCDFEETRRTLPLTTPLYGQAAFDYACPADLKGNRLIDLRPQANRQLSDVPVQIRSQEFDLIKTQVTSGSRLEVRWNRYLKTLRIALPALGNILLNDCATPTSNGTWTGSNGASNLETDNLRFVQGNSSIKYSQDASGTGTLTNTTMTAMDLTDYEDVSVLFMWVYNEANLPTSYAMRWGSDVTANYWSNTVTAQWDGSAFQEGWNLIGFDWQTATQTGSPDVTEVDAVQLDIVIVGAATPVNIDNIVVSRGSIYDIEYYSKYLFRNVAGAFKEKPTLDTDLVNLDTDSYGVYTNCVALFAAQQQQGRDSSFDLSYFERMYAQSAASYNMKYPSQAQKAVGSYYVVRRSSYADKYGGMILRP